MVYDRVHWSVLGTTPTTWNGPGNKAGAADQGFGERVDTAEVFEESIVSFKHSTVASSRSVCLME